MDHLIKINQHYILAVFCIITVSFSDFKLSAGEKHAEYRYPRLIAHAGGDYKGVPMTNSLQALNCSVREGFRFIEIDICKTGDGVYMLVHDWKNVKTILKTPLNNNIPSYKEIINAKKTHTMLDLKRFIKWMKKHKDVSIVTDVKDNNIEILKFLKEEYPEMIRQFIPQIYSFEEYTAVKEMGYENIILTLYKVKVSDEDIFSFCHQYPLFALTISIQRATTEFLKKCSGISVPVYVHTINDIFEYQKLRSYGAYGVYTDFFQPDTWIEK